MRKVLLSFLTTLLLLTFVGCQQSTTRTPFHREIEIPPQARLTGVNCGEPCAIIYDPNQDAIVALMLDGSTVIIKYEE
jgi:hypothetical protein